MLVTTSRKPCARARSFVKEFVRAIPGAVSLTRGKKSVDEVAEDARQEGHETVVFVTEMHGNPGGLRLMAVDESGWEWKPLSLGIKSVKLAREFKSNVKKPDALLVKDKIGLAPALGIESEESNTVLEATKETVTFFQNNKEVGPRITVRKVMHAARD